MEQLRRNKGAGNVLCNGPRWVQYKPDDRFTMGCNFPPCEVDATSIIDRAVITKWAHEPKLMKTHRIVLGKAAMDTMRQKPEATLFQTHPKITLMGWHKLYRSYYSSGHWAVYAMCRLGYEELYIYGCDSMFEGTIESTTDDIIEKGKDIHDLKWVGEWRKAWNRLASEEGKGVKFYFVDGRDENDQPIIGKTIFFDRKYRPDP